ncbi:unnamed protein product [Periconia digitata]|uniref:Uncharacterized protein n=1 Tax=Periconia digitata TaxID=1303443 RepID=A0A9W4UJT4_9PLEO|nr:unnamed protein product [Periconia digitata]
MAETLKNSFFSALPRPSTTNVSPHTPSWKGIRKTSIPLGNPSFLSSDIPHPNPSPAITKDYSKSQSNLPTTTPITKIHRHSPLTLTSTIS